MVPQGLLLSKARIRTARCAQTSHAEHPVTSYNPHPATNYVFDVSVGGLNQSLKTFSDADPVYKVLNWQTEKGTGRQIPET